jgi:hypothetical protein
MSETNSPSRPRRSFLKLGAVALAVIGAGGWFASYLTDKGARAVLDGSAKLDEQSQTMLAKLADAILDGALPSEAAPRAKAIAKVVGAADQAIGTLPPHMVKEVHDLFAMLGAAPTRALLIGQWTGWADATREDVGHMLTGLRHSSVELRRVVYISLRDMVAGSYYSSPDTWEQVGYPGPMIRGPGAEV